MRSSAPSRPAACPPTTTRWRASGDRRTHLSFLAIVLTNLRRRPARSLLTIAGIAVGITAVVALVSIAWGFEASWTRIYSARGTDLIVLRAGSLSAVPQVFSRDLTGHVSALPHVAATSGVLSDLVSVEDTPTVILFGWERPGFIWDHLRVLAGRLPNDNDEHVILVGSIAAEVLRKTVGSVVRIRGRDFTVCGIFETASVAENGAVLATLTQIQQVLDEAGKINFLNIKVAAGSTPEDVESVRRAIMAQQPDLAVYSGGQLAANHSGIQAVKAVSWATSGIALVIGALGVMNSVLAGVFERTQEIGMLLGVGWRRGRIVRLILCESLALSMAGGVAGLAAGTLVVRIMERTPLLRGKIEGEFGVWLFAVGMAIAIGLGLLGGLYPAFRGSRLEPADALRHE